jgi:hypothetical protein
MTNNFHKRHWLAGTQGCWDCPGWLGETESERVEVGCDGDGGGAGSVIVGESAVVDLIVGGNAMVGLIVGGDAADESVTGGVVVDGGMKAGGAMIDGEVIVVDGSAGEGVNEMVGMVTGRLCGRRGG